MNHFYLFSKFIFFPPPKVFKLIFNLFSIRKDLSKQYFILSYESISIYGFYLFIHEMGRVLFSSSFSLISINYASINDGCCSITTYTKKHYTVFSDPSLDFFFCCFCFFWIYTKAVRTEGIDQCRSQFQDALNLVAFPLLE